MLNGQAAEHAGKFPIYVSEDSIFPEDGSLFGRYVTKKKVLERYFDRLEGWNFYLFYGSTPCGRLFPLCGNADAVSFLIWQEKSVVLNARFR